MKTPHDKNRSDAALKPRLVQISKEPVELYKILKFEGLVSSGGEAKSVIAEGQVRVNNEVEIRKRKKIVAGDTIQFCNEIIQVERKP